jgi:hypothetical protein
MRLSTFYAGRRRNDLKVKTILAALLVCLASTNSTAADLILEYQIFAGGFDVGRNRLGLTTTDQAFRMRSELVTAGMINFMTGFSSIAQSEGEIGGHPQMFTRFNRTDSKFLGKPRWSTIEYPPEGPAVAAAEPPPEKDDREPVSPESTIGTVDPMTAGLIICRFASGDVETPMRIPVFDGRRRFDLEVKAAPMEERFKPISSQYYKGAALRIDVTLHRIAGYMKNPLFPGSDKPNSGQIWFLPPPDYASGFALPVRLEMDTVFGGVVIHLLPVK